jgi:hypothetical protein
VRHLSVVEEKGIRFVAGSLQRARPAVLHVRMPDGYSTENICSATAPIREQWIDAYRLNHPAIF